MTKPLYTGRMSRNADGTIVGELRDAWGWTITFIATRDADGYSLTGTLGEVPDALRVLAIDGQEGN